jgi:hypothetical protein
VALVTVFPVIDSLSGEKAYNSIAYNWKVLIEVNCIEGLYNKENMEHDTRKISK